MENSPVRSDAYFPEWKPAFSGKTFCRVSNFSIASHTSATSRPETLPGKRDNVVVYHLHEKTIWLEIVQMERKNFSWIISFGVCAFHLP